SHATLAPPPSRALQPEAPQTPAQCVEPPHPSPLRTSSEASRADAQALRAHATARTGPIDRERAPPPASCNHPAPADPKTTGALARTKEQSAHRGPLTRSEESRKPLPLGRGALQAPSPSDPRTARAAAARIPAPNGSVTPLASLAANGHPARKSDLPPP